VPYLGHVLVAAAVLSAVKPPPQPDAVKGAPDVEACPESPPDMACIAGGPFWRGSNFGPQNTRPQTAVWVQTYFMDAREVTVAQYEACVRAGDCTKAKTNYGSDYSRPRQPKVGVSWYQAVAFCKAAGKHLPTEAEWEKAARGSDARRFPWGDELATCSQAIIMDAQGRRSCGVPWKGGPPEKGRTFEVGARPPNQFGLYDMSGNAWEWVADWFSESYRDCGAACVGVDPKGPCQGKETCPGHTERVVRGGSWYWPATYATTFYRRAHVPSNRPYHHYGFRCAASIEEAEVLRGRVAAKTQ
jgi:formylglycine-generating enzyme required for sulfatase activity